MAALLATVVLMSIGQQDLSDSGAVASKLLRVLNLDPSVDRPTYTDELFRPMPIDEAILDSLTGSVRSLTDTNGYPGLAFVHRRVAQADPDAPLAPGMDIYPVILLHDGTEWGTIFTTPFAGSRWVYASRSSDGSRSLAILDHEVEGPGHALPILTSRDGGWTWEHMTSVRKPNYLFGFRDLIMEPDGTGSLTVGLRDVSEITGPYRMGVIMTTRTADGGKSWSTYSLRLDDRREGTNFWTTRSFGPDRSIRESLEFAGSLVIGSLERFANQNVKYDRDDLPISPAR